MNHLKMATYPTVSSGAPVLARLVVAKLLVLSILNIHNFRLFHTKSHDLHAPLIVERNTLSPQTLIFQYYSL